MLYGLYLSSQGAQLQSQRLQVIANNLANAQTTGFKRDLALFQAHGPYSLEQGRPGDLPDDEARAHGGLSLAAVVTDHSQGPLQQTGGALDVALLGEGFFRVTDGQREFLTRAGSFTLDDSGRVWTGDGKYQVQGTGGGTLQVAPGAGDVEIADDGRVTQIQPDGTRAEVGRFDLVRPAAPDRLEKVGHNLYQARGPLQPADGTRVRQGSLEASAVEPVKEMLQMIETTRTFETNVNMIRQQDETLARLLQGMARR